MHLEGWGRYPTIEADQISFDEEQQLIPYLQDNEELLAYGLGRSYGDSALHERVIAFRRFCRFIDFDSTSGVLVCEAGVSLSDIIDAFLPRGWFLSITPGTKYITLGGAVACDVHGKNHHVKGAFSESVLWFDLMLPSGEKLRCSREENLELFLATCGGMGLTGLISHVAIRLQKVTSAYFRQKIFKTKNLKETFESFTANAGEPYFVAWFDCLATGEKLGRSLLITGRWHEDEKLNLKKKKTISVPFDSPSFLLNRFSVSLFNYAYYERVQSRKTESIVSYDTFFYPLDFIDKWNRLYGKNGFTQYQFVLPAEASYDGLKIIMEKIANCGMGSFLVVLKLLGKENDNYLSFPMEGVTLAIDFKMQPGLLEFLDELDRIVLDHGGRLYLAKDARQSADTFSSSYPKLDAFRAVREKYGLREKFNSVQSRRLEI